MLHARISTFFLLFLISCSLAFAQNPSETHSKIRRAVENREYKIAADELQNLQKADVKTFELNNYDYLLARMSEKTGDFGAATANYQTIVNRNSILSEYALWHLSEIFRSSGNLFLERIYLQKLLAVAPESLIANAANERLVRSYFESKDYDSAIQMLTKQSSNGATDAKISNPKTTNTELSRENSVLLGQSFLQSGKIDEARGIFAKLTDNLQNPAQPDDYALAGAKALDEIAVGKDNFGKIVPSLAENEHYKRAQIYQFNRNFSLARLHYRAIIEKYPSSSYVPIALFQIGRGYAQR